MAAERTAPPPPLRMLERPARRRAAPVAVTKVPAPWWLRWWFLAADKLR